MAVRRSWPLIQTDHNGADGTDNSPLLSCTGIVERNGWETGGDGGFLWRFSGRIPDAPREAAAFPLRPLSRVTCWRVTFLGDLWGLSTRCFYKFILCPCRTENMPGMCFVGWEGGLVRSSCWASEHSWRLELGPWFYPLRVTLPGPVTLAVRVDCAMGDLPLSHAALEKHLLHHGNPSYFRGIGFFQLSPSLHVCYLL